MNKLEMNETRAATMKKILEGGLTMQLQKEDREALIELYMENLTTWEKRLPMRPSITWENR